MLKIISFKLAVNTLLVLFSCVIVFNSLVLMQIIPYDIVWGGRLENAVQMRQFESVSIFINLLIILVVATKGQYIKLFIPIRILNFLLWLLVILFSVNTIGNVLAVTSLETYIFTPITLVSAVFCYRIAIEKQAAPAKDT